jgi:hydroxymethylpyrimidine/phosphomethylpyrimidine kinase
MNLHGQDQDFTPRATTIATQASGGRAGRPVVLSIGGFDPSSGAGVTADLKVFAAHGIYGMACITALTVQSTQGVRSVEPVRPEIVAATLKMLAEDVDFLGVKLGMLATAAICEVVGEFLDSILGVPVVLDPVLRSSSGRELLETAGVRLLSERLLARAGWITPNREELAILTGAMVANREDVPDAAERLRKEAGNNRLNVLVTGGDQNPPEDYLLSAAGDSHWISGRRVETSSTHGTGCAFSSALLCRLVAGDPPLVAARSAKEYITEALLAADPVGRGNGPMHHLFRLEKGV